MSIPSLTVNRPCTRCPRVERTEVTVEEVVRMAKAKEEAPPCLVVTRSGEIVHTFDYLCTQCTLIVQRYLDHALKVQKKESSLRERATVDVEETD